MSDKNSVKKGNKAPLKEEAPGREEQKREAGARIKRARMELGYTQADFVRELPGLAGKSLSNVETGQNGISEELLRYLLDHHHISPLWVLTGIGNMVLSEDDNLPPIVFRQHRPTTAVAEPTARYDRSEPKIIPITVDPAGNETIQQVGSQARASYLQKYLEPEFLRDLPTISLPGAKWRNGTFRAFEVAGDSMQTTLHPGDLVLCQKLYKWPEEIREGYVHIVVTQDDILVKRVLNRLNETGQLVLQSDNIQYATQLLDGDEVHEVWVARAYLSSQFTNSRYDAVRELSNTQADVAELNDQVSRLCQVVEKLTGEKLVKKTRAKKS